MNELNPVKHACSVHSSLAVQSKALFVLHFLGFWETYTYYLTVGRQMRWKPTLMSENCPSSMLLLVRGGLWTLVTPSENVTHACLTPALLHVFHQNRANKQVRRRHLLVRRDWNISWWRKCLIYNRHFTLKLSVGLWSFIKRYFTSMPIVAF